MVNKTKITKSTKSTVVGRVEDIYSYLDNLARRHTAFKSFGELVNAQGGYAPSLMTNSAPTIRQRIELSELATAYDIYQFQRSDDRRAHRS